MKILPQANNAISIFLDNGDRFDIHSPNEQEIVISRPQHDRSRNYKVDTMTSNGEWVYQFVDFMIRVSKTDK